MESKRMFNVLGIIFRTALIGVMISVGLGLTGCGDQMARMEENQLKLQAMIEANAEQIAIIAANMEQNQYELENRVGKVQNGTSSVASDIAAVADMQMKLEAMVQKNTQQLSGDATIVEQVRKDVQTGIQSVHNETQKLIDNVAVITTEQARQHQVMQGYNDNVSQRLAAVEQNQQQWQTTADVLQNSIEKLSVTVDTLGQKLVTLRDILQANVREITGTMETANNGRIQYQQEMNNHIQALTDSMMSIQQSQNDLKEQFELRDMQDSDAMMTSQVMPESPVAVNEFYPDDSVEFVDVAPYPVFTGPVETNSVQ